VEFEDGINGVIDLCEWKGKGVFVFWNDENNFREFEIIPDKKIKWNEDIDMDPDALFYLEIVNKTFSEYAGNQQFLRYSHENVFW
jgi:hypothetical protein